MRLLLSRTVKSKKALDFRKEVEELLCQEGIFSLCVCLHCLWDSKGSNGLKDLNFIHNIIVVVDELSIP